MREKAKPTVQIDNDKVKVTRWDFSPGAETGWHRHVMDYVVVPLTDGTLTAEMPDGSVVENKLTVGASYVRPVGVEHNIINNNDCLLYTSPSPRDVEESRMPSSA